MGINLKKYMNNFFQKEETEFTTEDILEYKSQFQEESNVPSAILKDPYITQLNSDNDTVLLFSKHNKDNNSLELFVFDHDKNLITSKVFVESSEIIKHIERFCIAKDSSFAIVLSTYYPDNPHLSLGLYVYSNSGVEVFHTLCTSIGINALTFSENSLYFSAFVNNDLIIIDMKLLCTYVFEPINLKECDTSVININEDNRTISLRYQHPNTPSYHFTFSGRLIEETLFNTNSKSLDAKYFDFLNEVNSLENPITDEIFIKYKKKFLDMIDDPLYIDYQSWLYRYLGEFLLKSGNEENALFYLEKALSLNPQVGVKRLIQKLKKSSCN